jgi:hypothetical protein
MGEVWKAQDTLLNRFVRGCKEYRKVTMSAAMCLTPFKATRCPVCGLRWTPARPKGRFTIQIAEVKNNAPIDDARFAK